MSPGVTRYHDRLNADVSYLKDLSILQKNLLIICLHHRELVCAEYDFPADFSCHISVLDFTQIKCCMPEESV